MEQEMRQSDDLGWGETISEWIACAGVGLLPLFCDLVGAIFENNPIRAAMRVNLGTIAFELLLFCVVTNAASVLIYLSKYNVLVKISPILRPIPIGLMFLVFPMLIVNIYVLAVFFPQASSHADWLDIFLWTISCMTGTVILTLILERWIGLTVHALRFR
jgi:hypothetical protein